jgi:predicted tellurium resistance membrane protein TerC
MSVWVHSAQTPGLVVFNIVVGLIIVRGILRLIARLTQETPSLGCIGLPVIALVTATSLAIWTLATA